MLRHKIPCQEFEERFTNNEKCHLQMIYGSAVVICYNILLYVDEKYSLFDRKKCITDYLNGVEFCSICITHVFKNNNILHNFKLKW